MTPMATLLADLALVVAGIASGVGDLAAVLMEPPFSIFIGLAILSVGWGMVRGFIGRRKR